ncbi:hypothetical protein LTR66_005192 [Elasticomyces elasticus]|nr:hypothetical protein LTR66_005192 [Elasticomyces elasticus]
MADYSKLKNVELETMLKERGLPHTGKKADLVARLHEHDKDQSSSTVKAPEDEIDWDDDAGIAPAVEPEDVKQDAENATSEPAAAAIEAGGIGQVSNPQAVPNQAAAINPATTDDLTVSDPAEKTNAAKTETSAKEEPAKEKTPVDFSSGLATTDLDQEIAKRKARAEKWGTAEKDDEALKVLQRAKKFGTTETASKLDQALPEKRERKRGRDAEEDDGAKKRRGGGRPNAGDNRGGSRRGGGERRGGGAERRGGGGEKRGGGGGGRLKESDRAAAEARKKRFAPTAAS